MPTFQANFLSSVSYCMIHGLHCLISLTEVRHHVCTYLRFHLLVCHVPCHGLRAFDALIMPQLLREYGIGNAPVDTTVGALVDTINTLAATVASLQEELALFRGETVNNVTTIQAGLAAEVPTSVDCVTV